jgi:hypothetical protein
MYTDVLTDKYMVSQRKKVSTIVNIVEIANGKY